MSVTACEVIAVLARGDGSGLYEREGTTLQGIICLHLLSLPSFPELQPNTILSTQSVAVFQVTQNLSVKVLPVFSVTTVKWSERRLGKKFLFLPFSLFVDVEKYIVAVSSQDAFQKRSEQKHIM